MRKGILILVLIIGLLAGFIAFGTGGNPQEPAAVLPLESTFPDVAELPLLTPSPDNQDEPSPTPSSELTGAPTEEPMPVHITTSVVRSETLDQVFSENPELYGSVLIVKNGEILLYKGYGLADYEKGTPNTISTKFIIGSITKQFTAMAIMQLYEKGMLDIHDKLSKYVPDFTRGDEITLTELLTQTSGIIDYFNEDPPLISEVPYEELSQEHLIELIKNEPLKFEPGLKYSYSNSNYLLLGYIIEKVSVMDYGDYLSRYIFEPLGMKNTGIYDVDHPPDNMAAGHIDYETPIRYAITGSEEDDYTKSAAAGYGAGSIYSTVGDLYIWDQALSTEKLLSKEYMDMMFVPSAPIEGTEIECSYGFGWVIENDPDCGIIYRHTGSLAGFRGYNGLFTEKNITAIVLYNNRAITDREKIIPSLKEALNAL